MAKTAVVGKGAKSPNCVRVPMYVDGYHIGYFEVEMSYMRSVLDPLENAGWRIVDACTEGRENGPRDRADEREEPPTSLIAIVSKGLKSPNCVHLQMHGDGDRIGYMKVEAVHLRTVLDPLEDAGWTIIDTRTEGSEPSPSHALG
jgi:hypothetical protein